MKKLVFVCSGNTCRSPMARALFGQLLKEADPIKLDEYEIVSAGIFAVEGVPASPEAIEVMNEVGLDLNDHQARKVTREILENATWVVTMSQSHRDYIIELYPEIKSRVASVYEFAGQEHQEISDPFGGGVDVYRACRDELRQILGRAIENRSF